MGLRNPSELAKQWGADNMPIGGTFRFRPEWVRCPGQARSRCPLTLPPNPHPIERSKDDLHRVLLTKSR